uniref:Integral membrane protein n=1 Tax=Mycena chlorophos TaxID=658473 RepID=A0ABQ0LSP2_MYCCL|nr:predicted protein [Mycena chlorophos]
MSSADTFLSVQTWGMFLESLFFGFYLITCVSVFRAPRLGWWKLVLFFLFLAKTSSSIALHLDLNLYLATINQPVDTMTELRSTANPLNIGKYTTGLIEVVLGSGFFTYRCWLTYNRNYLVVLPSALIILGGVVVMCMVIRIDVAHKVDGILAESFTFGAVFWGLFLAVNLISTTLIIYRLVCTSRAQESAFDVHPDFLVEDRDDVQSATTSGMPTKLQSPLTRPEPVRAPARCQYDSGRTRNTIVDSASLPTLSLLLTFVLFVVKTQAVYAAVDVLVQVIGIAFNLIMAGNRNPADENLNLDAEHHELHALARLTPGRHGSSRMTPASMQSSGIDFAFPRTFDPRRPSGPAQTQSQTESLERATLTATPLPGETVTRTEESFLAADVSRTQTRSRNSLY